jgi:NADH:ubiquinone oxidoreductase subunit 5 (subunit L)/multisubunit Na+/H+ antiporter MnhA subunit
MPITHLVFLAACLAISGIPPFAGFFSKEEILMNAWENNRPIFWIADPYIRAHSFLYVQIVFLDFLE